MAQTVTNSAASRELEASRVVRYDDLQPCTTAFIDTRTPGSARKENFTIIGPGVAENPDQFVHIDIPHGFNIGAARQPPGCINSQHSHETAEVFIVHSGEWAFLLGPNREDGEIVLAPGDTISIPTNVFRGFRNVGKETGFLFAVLGGDDPGHVTWAPYVFEDAKRYGLVLLDDGSLVDTTKGETIPEGRRPMPPTSEEEVARHDRLTSADLAGCVVRREALRPTSVLGVPEIKEFPIIGASSPDEGLAAGKMAWPHGFHVRLMSVDPGVKSVEHTRSEEEVIMMHEGCLTVEIAGGRIDLHPGDVFTVPIGAPRRFTNPGNSSIFAYVVRGSDRPLPATLTGNPIN